MTDFIILCGECYLRYFPLATWEQAMEEITSGSPMARYIARRVFNENYI